MPQITRHALDQALAVSARWRAAGLLMPVAVNVDPGENDPVRMTPAAFVAAVPRSRDAAPVATATDAGTREHEQSLWRYGLLLMLAALVVESAIGRRA